MAESFRDRLNKRGAEVERRVRRVFVHCSEMIHESIVEGSPLTGAPGQPVDTGNLRASWVRSFPEPNVSQSATNVDYAPHVEENVRGVTFRNHGPHSVELTKLGFRKIVETAVRAEVGNG